MGLMCVVCTGGNCKIRGTHRAMPPNSVIKAQIPDTRLLSFSKDTPGRQVYGYEEAGGMQEYKGEREIEKQKGNGRGNRKELKDISYFLRK